MKKLIEAIIAAVAVAVILSGCATNNPNQNAINLAAVQFAAQAFVSTDIVLRPGDLQAAQAAQIGVCAIASSTNATPAAISALLYNLNAGGKLDAVAVQNLDSLVRLISMVELSNTNLSGIQAVASAACNGLTDGIGIATSK